MDDAERGRNAGSAGDRRSGRILIVDGDQAARKALGEPLRERGYVVLEAGSAEEAAPFFAEGQVDLVLCELVLPGTGGIDFLCGLEDRLASGRMAAIMIAAQGGVGEAVLAMQLGAYSFLAKPVEQGQLLLLVGKAMEKSESLRAQAARNGELEQKIREQAKRIGSFTQRMASSLFNVYEVRDASASGRSFRTARYAVLVARKSGWGGERLSRLEMATELRDIGMMGIPDGILNKPGRLTREEYEIVKRHPLASERILKPVMDDRETLNWIRHHHERWDGAGYPDGLAGDKIPLACRIIALSDTYDAMTSLRSYRGAFGIDQARSEIAKLAGIQFDPDLVPVFLSLNEKDFLMEGMFDPRTNGLTGGGTQTNEPGQRSRS